MHIKRGRKKYSVKRNPNQLTLDFTSNVPIEIHIPKNNLEEAKKDFNFSWQRKTAIELVRN